MTLRLRFTFDVDFDSVDTVKAFGVALGWAIKGINDSALALSEAPAPAIARHPVVVSEISEARHG